MKTELYTLPATWSNALINYDYSGLDDREQNNLLTWLSLNGFELNSCLNIGDYDPVVMRCNIGSGVMVYCECLEYTFKLD